MSGILFASVDDLAARLGVIITPSEQVRASQLLVIASDIVESAAGQSIGHITGDVLVRRGSSESSTVRLQSPVTLVTSVFYTTLGGSPVLLGASEYYLDGSRLYRYGYEPWFDSETLLSITYNHGYTIIPAIARQVTLELVVRAWVNPGAVVSESHGGESVQYGPLPIGMMLTEAEHLLIKREFGSNGSGFWSVQLT